MVVGQATVSGSEPSSIVVWACISSPFKFRVIGDTTFGGDTWGGTGDTTTTTISASYGLGPGDDVYTIFVGVRRVAVFAVFFRLDGSHYSTPEGHLTPTETSPDNGEFFNENMMKNSRSLLAWLSSLVAPSPVLWVHVLNTTAVDPGDSRVKHLDTHIFTITHDFRKCCS